MTEVKIEAPPKGFIGLAEAARYLNSIGYKITRQGLDRHYKAGRLPRLNSGFLAKDVEEFALKHLKSQAQKTSDEVGKYNALKLKADALNKDIAAKRGQLKLDLEKGKLIERAKHEEELGARMAFFKRELETFMLTYAPQAVKVVQESTNPVKALIAWWEGKADGWLDIWARKEDFAIGLEVTQVEPGILGKSRGRARGGPSGPKPAGPKNPKDPKL